MPIRDFIGELAGEAVESGAVRVAVKTNLGPEFAVGEGAGLTRALGIRGAVIVRDRSGRVLFTYGEPPATNPVLLAVLVGAAAVVTWAALRGVLKR